MENIVDFPRIVLGIAKYRDREKRKNDFDATCEVVLAIKLKSYKRIENKKNSG